MTEHTSENRRNVSCSKCAWIGRDNEPHEADWKDFDCGVILCPVGCCPQCGKFVYYDHEKAEWLIARAAPDLLAALEHIDQVLHHGANGGLNTANRRATISDLKAVMRHARDDARAAIAKARQ